MKLDPKLRKILNACIAAFVAWAIVGILLNSKELSSVSVTLLPDGVEHTDKTVLGVGKGDEAADYQLRLRSKKDGWIDLGTFANTPIGTGLTFTPSESIPMRTIQEVMLLDEDKMESDVLDQGPLVKGEYQGVNYSFKAASAFSLEAGFHWFFATPVGLAILFGIGAAVFLVVLSNISFRTRRDCTSSLSLQ